MARRLAVEPLETRAMLHAAGVLSGFVYLDANHDGQRNEGETGVPGVRVTLSDSGSPAMSRSQLTDDNGFYSFDELEPGTYRLSQRQTPALVDGADTTLAVGAVTGNDLFTNVVLADDQSLTNNNFGEGGLRPEYTSIRWFFASRPPVPRLLRETIAMGEELAGDPALAASIRAAATDVEDEPNRAPVASDDTFTVDENGVLTVNAASGVLANDSDADGDPLTATLVSGPSHGAVSLAGNGSFTYTPDGNYSGPDSFTYRASDGETSSNTATARITVNEIGNNNVPFGAVTTGPFDAPGLLGVRTDLLPGAPPITAPHVSTSFDYTGYSNPPTYGPHHAFIASGGNSITPRPTGVYSTEQPDEDLIHNLEHGHVWISYNPALLNAAERLSLEQLVIGGGVNTGVILTPRVANTSPISLASWAHLLDLPTFDPVQIRNFVNTNRGHAPEGYIPSGQKADNAASETLDDGLQH